MDIKGQLKALRSGNLSRSSFKALAIAAAAGVLMAGQAMAQERVLKVTNWAEYIAEDTIMDDPRIVSFEPNGPADTGLIEWEQIDASELEAGNPVQRGHIYHQDEASGYMAGVWDCTPMTSIFAPYHRGPC